MRGRSGSLTCGWDRLNSTLSARIEELNAQISSLYVENLRLRASEIALTSQLKKEREKSKKILADAESAVRLFDSLYPNLSDVHHEGPHPHEAIWPHSQVIWSFSFPNTDPRTSPPSTPRETTHSRSQRLTSPKPYRPSPDSSCTYRR